MKQSPIVIVGAGISGLQSALTLDRLLGASLDSPIFLIDQCAEHYYSASPFDLLSSLQPRITAIPLSDILEGKNIHFIHDTVTHIDLDRKRVVTEHQHLPYSDLVLAVGMQNRLADTATTPRKQEDDLFVCHAFDDVMRIRRHVERCLRDAQLSPKGFCRHHFMIVGGGPTAVECAAGLHALGRQLVAEYDLAPTDLHITVLEAGETILPEFPEVAREKVRQFFRDNDITLRLNAHISPKSARKLTALTHGLPKNTVIWTIGGEINPLVKQLREVPHDSNGCILVDGSLRAVDAPALWAIGNVASVIDGGTLESAAAHGRHVAYAIRALRRGDPVPIYTPGDPSLIIPLASTYGIGWFGNRTLEGASLVWYKRYQTVRYLFSILPPGKAFAYWQNGGEDFENMSLQEPIANQSKT